MVMYKDSLTIFPVLLGSLILWKQKFTLISVLTQLNLWCLQKLKNKYKIGNLKKEWLKVYYV